MPFLTYIYTIGAAQGFILAIALWRKAENKQSNRILSIWLLTMAFDLAIKTLFLNGVKSYIFRPYNLVQLFPFLYASFFYLYVRTLISKKKIAKKDLIHFSAFIFFICINIPYLINPWKNQVIGFQYYDMILYVYSISYVTSGLILINNYRNNLKQQQVDTQDVDLM